MEKVDPHYKERETTLEMTAITEKTHSVVLLSLALSNPPCPQAIMDFFRPQISAINIKWINI